MDFGQFPPSAFVNDATRAHVLTRVYKYPNPHFEFPGCIPGSGTGNYTDYTEMSLSVDMEVEHMVILCLIF